MTRTDAELLLLEGVAAAKRAEPGTAAQSWVQLLAASADADLRTQAYFNLGLVSRRCGNLDAAMTCFQHALEEDAENHEAREHLAMMLVRRGEVDAAVEQLQRLVLAKPDTRHYFNLGMVLAHRGDPAAAEAAYRKGLESLPRDANGFGNAGEQLTESGMNAAAVRCLAQAADALSDADAGALLEARNHLDAAACFLERAVALAPEEPVRHYELAALRVEQRRLGEAEAGFRQALRIAPDYHRAAVSLAHVLLGQGANAEGWRLHETRFMRLVPDAKFVRAAPSTPIWQGEPLRGKVLLLRQEQGFGDEIQFIRYLPRLRALGPARIVMQSHAALCPLLTHLPGLDEVVVEGDALPSHDVWISTISLPLYCGGEDIPAEIPYLQASRASRERWAGRLGPAAGRLRVGLLWQGNQYHINDAHRSLSSFGQLASLWDIDDVEFVSLQRENIETELPLRQFGDEITDFAEAAGLVAQLDLVISVDSAYAHLAGALGKPVWTLLPRRGTDWRWGYAGETAAWYPHVMRLFRQTQRGDWTGPIMHVTAALRTLQADRTA